MSYTHSVHSLDRLRRPSVDIERRVRVYTTTGLRMPPDIGDGRNFDDTGTHEINEDIQTDQLHVFDVCPLVVTSCPPPLPPLISKSTPMSHFRYPLAAVDGRDCEEA